MKKPANLSNLEKATALLKGGRIQEAKVAYEAILLRDSNNLEANLNYAYLIKSENPYKAFEILTVLKEKYPKKIEVLTNYAAICMRLSRFKEAGATYKSIEKKFKATEIPHTLSNNIGNYYQHSGNFEAAKIQYLIALEKKENYLDALLNLLLLPNVSESDLRKAFSTVDTSKIASTAENGKWLIAVSKLKKRKKRGFIQDLSLGKSLLLEGNKEVIAIEQKIMAIAKTKIIPPIKSTNNLSARPIFIVGMPRSGTTLIEQMLDMHSEIKGLGEQTTIQNFLHANGFFDKEAWSEEQSLELRALYEDIIVEYKINGARYIIDKNPLNFRFIGPIKNVLPEAIFIHMQRDPIATCWSCFDNYFPDGMAWTLSMEKIADFFKLYSDAMAYWKNLYSKDIMEIHYSNLVVNPENELKKITQRLGLPWDKNMLSFSSSSRVVTTASSIQVRQNIYSGADEKWRQYEDQLKSLLDRLRAHKLI